MHHYATLNGIVNGVDGTFQYYIENNPKPLIWIYFHNLQIKINMQIKNFHIYKQFFTTGKKCTLIKQKIAEIQLGSNPFHIIIRIQFPIQLVATHTSHQVQGLPLNCLAFYPSGVTKHGLTYIALSQVHFKEHLYLLSPWLKKNLQVNTLVQEEMHCLKTITQYEITIAYLESYH